MTHDPGDELRKIRSVLGWIALWLFVSAMNSCGTLHNLNRIVHAIEQKAGR